jgi:ferredoxin
LRTDTGHPGALSPPTAEERAHLSETELTQGFRLACQCYPERNDLHLELEAQVVL